MLILLLTLYIGSFLFSYPFAMKYCKIHEDDYPISYKWLGTTLALIPILNIWSSWSLFVNWFALKVSVYKLRRVAKRTGNEDLAELADALEEFNKIDMSDE